MFALPFVPPARDRDPPVGLLEDEDGVTDFGVVGGYRVNERLRGFGISTDEMPLGDVVVTFPPLVVASEKKGGSRVDVPSRQSP